MNKIKKYLLMFNKEEKYNQIKWYFLHFRDKIKNK